MTIEDKVRSIIMNKYKSMREFSIDHDIPYTTLKSMLSRGFGNSSVNNVIKLCKALGISADALADGEIVSVKKRTSVPINDMIEVKDVLDDTKDILTHSGFITLDGKPLNKTDIESIIDAMDVGVEIAKRKKR